MVFLISISLILHLFTFFWIIILMQKINVHTANPKEFNNVKKEIEDILLAYTEEMKDENEKLLLELKKMKQENALLNKKIEETKQAIPSESVEHNENVQRSIPNKVTPQQRPLTNVYAIEKNRNHDDEYDQYEPPTIVEEPQEDIFEQSDTAKVLSLAKQGFNAEQIAKKLDLGKGEVELVLKFYHS